jgi:hypothetical protein
VTRFLHEFVDVSQVLVRIAVPVIAVVYAVMAGIPPSPHEIGTHAIVFDERARSFVTDGNKGSETRHRIRVVDFGLEQGMGLAFKPGEPAHVYVADAWDAIFDCELDRRNGDPRCVNDSDTRKRRVPALDVCPFGQCIAVEHGGLALRPAGILYVSDAHQRRVSKRDLSNPSKVESIGEEVLGRIHDVGLFGDAVIVAEGPVDDGRDVDEKDANEQDAADTSEKVRKKGSVYELSATGIKTPVKADFTHPVGVAYSSRTRRLYVVDISGRVETWRYFERAQQSWKEKGVLWTQTLPNGDDWPRLQSMVIGEAAGTDGEGIFAAGPDGLYVFHSDGTLLAKYVLRTPVSGLVWGHYDPKEKTTELFMTVGRRLSVLMTKATPVDPHVPVPGPGATPVLSASTAPPTSQPPARTPTRPRQPSSPALGDSAKPSQPKQQPSSVTAPRTTTTTGSEPVTAPIQRAGPVDEPVTVKNPERGPLPRSAQEPTPLASPCTCDEAGKVGPRSRFGSDRCTTS